MIFCSAILAEPTDSYRGKLVPNSNSGRPAGCVDITTSIDTLADDFNGYRLSLFRCYTNNKATHLRLWRFEVVTDKEQKTSFLRVIDDVIISSKKALRAKGLGLYSCLMKGQEDFREVSPGTATFALSPSCQTTPNDCHFDSSFGIWQMTKERLIEIPKSQILMCKINEGC